MQAGKSARNITTSLIVALSIVVSLFTISAAMGHPHHVAHRTDGGHRQTRAHNTGRSVGGHGAGGDVQRDHHRDCVGKRPHSLSTLCMLTSNTDHTRTRRAKDPIGADGQSAADVPTRDRGAAGIKRLPQAASRSKQALRRVAHR